MKRLYFLIPDISMAKSIVDGLFLAGIEEKHIHIIAKEGIPLDELPEASLLQKSDLIPALERGFALGGVAGVLAGVVALSFPPAGVVLGGGAILSIALAGAGIGAWLSSMIGVDVENTQLKAFESAIEAGQILMLVDVVKDRADDINKLVEILHPEVEIGTTEPTIL
jgi:hypothetical protein